MSDNLVDDHVFMGDEQISLFLNEVCKVEILSCPEFESDIVAPAICYELSNKGHYEFAAQNNANVYLASVLNSVSGIDSDLKKLSDIARNYKMVTFMANFIGESGGYKCAGKSSVWNEKGEIIKQLGEKDEGLIIFDTETKEIITATNNPALRQA